MKVQSREALLFYLVIMILGYTGIANMTFPVCRLLPNLNSFDKSGIRLWPGGRIPYTVNLNQDAYKVFEMAIAEFHAKTCLRFEPKSSSDYNHVHVVLTNGICCCALAHLCLQNVGRQIISVKPSCSQWISTYLHELGHATCLDHEQVRVDRNDYLHYPDCNNPSDIEPIEYKLTNRIQVYDYHSTMHYQCGGCSGVPKLGNVPGCGVDANSYDLSVIDIDRLNELYNCQGCHRHRWYRVDSLTSAEEATLVNFAEHVEGHEPAFLCRGFIEGTILPGTYVPSEKACDIIVDSELRRVFKDIQVFGLPDGPNIITSLTTGYRLLSPRDTETKPGFTAMGRYRNNAIAEATVKEMENPDGTKRILLGVVLFKLFSATSAHFWYNDQLIYDEVQDDSTDEITFYIVGCAL